MIITMANSCSKKAFIEKGLKLLLLISFLCFHTFHPLVQNNCKNIVGRI